ncbi:MAG: LamG-like jellyroll fold domain-containing protein [Zavarzinella sp.]
MNPKNLITKRIVAITIVAGLFGALLIAQVSKRDPAASSLTWQFSSKQLRGKDLQPISGGQNARVLGAPTWSEDLQAVILAGDADGFLVEEKAAPDSPLLPKQDFSASAWVRIDKGTQYGGIVGAMQDNGSYERGWALGYNEKNFTFGVVGTPGEGAPKLTTIESTTIFEPGKWYHLCGTYDGKTMRLYVNGKEEKTSSEQKGPVSYAPSAPFVIGRYRDDNEDFPLVGAIREVSVDFQAISPATIAQRLKSEQALLEKQAAKPIGFVIYPYLQHPTTNSVTVMWETAAPGTSVVEYGITPADTKEAVGEKDVTIHEVKVTNLEIETGYVYRVKTETATGEKLTSDWFQMKTAVKPDSAFSFAIIGDTQRNPTITAKIAQVMYDRRPHFAMHVGDVVNDGPIKDQWVNDLFGPAKMLFSRVAVFPTLGNHERNHAWYYRYFSLPNPEYYYSYSYGNAEFFVVDTNKSVKAGTEQFQWLDKALGNSKAKWKFVYHHHPAWSSDSDDYGKTALGARGQGDKNARSLVELYEKHNVDIVFNGHIHLYERTWPLRGNKVDRSKGVIYITSGGGGGRLEDFDPLPTWFKAQLRVDYHACYVNIHGNQLEFKAFDQNSNLFDSFDLKKE